MKQDQAPIRNRGRLRSTMLPVALAGLLLACSDPSPGPEAEVREWLQRGVAAAEAKDRGALMEMISPAYTDARGYDRARVGDILRIYFLRMNSIELITSVDEIKVMGDSAAEAVVTAGMAGKHDGILGFSADAYRFSFELEKSGGEWDLISARWAELGKELK